MIFTKEKQKQIIDMYKDNVGIDEIISVLDCEERDIRTVLKEFQIDRVYNTFSQELNNRVIQLYAEKKYTFDKICYTLLVSDTGIRKILNRNNVPRRSYSENNRRFNRNQHYFDVIDTPNKAYVLGMLYADGCNHTAHNAINIHLQEEDKEVLEKIKNELEYEGELRFNPLHEKNARHKNSYILCINDEYMSKKLEGLGVVNAKSLSLTFPTFLSEDLLSHFVRGYFDGDGCVYYYEKFQKCQTQTCGTRDFCEHLSQILHSLGIKNSIKHPKQCHENTVVLSTNGNKSTYQFLSWLYKDADLKMDRKYQRYLYFCEKYEKQVA